MKIFQTVRKLVRIIGGGGQGVTFSTGSDAASDRFTLATTFDAGSDAAADGFRVTPTVSTGSDAQAMAVSVSTASVHPQGSDAATGPGLVITGPTQATGTDSVSLAVNVTAQLSDQTATATNNTDAGSTAWQNPANAQGPFNGTEASWSLSAGLALTTGTATLRCAGLNLPTTPTGFTRTGIEVVIRHRWDLTITLPAVDTASQTVTLRDSGGALLGTIFTRNEDAADATRAALADDAYNVAALASEAQFTAGVQVWCQIAASLSLATSGNVSWQVDGVHLRATYTRSGLT